MNSLHPDLDGTICSVIGCFAVADVLGTADLALNVLVGAVEEVLVVTIPLCANHAHLLRMPPTLTNFDEGLR